MPSPFNPDRHDIGILRADSITNVGFLLLRDKNNTPVYQEFDDEYLAAQMFTGVPGYSNLPPEKELAIRQDDWRSGYGLEYFDADDPKRYYESVGMDLRFRNMGILGPTVQKLANIATPVDFIIPNNGFETVGANWVGGIYNSIAPYAGTNCLGITSNASQDILTGWASNLNVGLTVFAKGAGGNSGRIAINTGVGETESGYLVNGSGGWNEHAIWRVIEANASQLRLTLQGGVSVNVFYDQASLAFLRTVNVGVSRAFAEFNDNLYLASNNILAKMQANGNGLDLIASLPANITALEPFVDDQLYIALANSANYRVMNTAGAIMGASGAAVQNTFTFFKTVHSGSPTMWGGNSANKIRSSTNPSDASTWSGVTNVGSSYNEITGLHSRSGALYIMKQDMPYYLNSSGAVQNDLAPEMAALVSEESGKNSLLWLNKLYIPAGTQGLMETDGTTNTWRNPSKDSTNNSRYIGRIMALAADEEYLFAIMKSSNTPYIFGGRSEVIDSTTKWVWHPIQQFTQTNTETMFVSSLVKKRLYIASSVASEGVSFIDLPTGYGDITGDANRNFATAGYFWTPWLHGGFKDTKKVFPELSITMAHNYNVDVGINTMFQLFGSLSTNSLGIVYGTGTNHSATYYLPTNTVSEMIRLRFQGVSPHRDITPILSSYRLKSILYPPKRTIIACTVVASQEQLLNDGTVDKGSYATQKAVLDEAKDAQWPVTIYDIDGAARTVKFLPLPGNVPRFTIVKSEKGRKQERHYNLLLQVVSLS